MYPFYPPKTVGLGDKVNSSEWEKGKEGDEPLIAKRKQQKLLFKLISLIWAIGQYILYVIPVT